MQSNRSTTAYHPDPIGAIRGLFLPTLLMLLGVLIFAHPGHAQGQYCGGADLNGDGGIGGPDYQIFGACMTDPNYASPETGVLGISNGTQRALYDLSLNGHCVETFGEGARMCRSSEVAHLPPPVWLPSGTSAWVRPLWGPQGDIATGREPAERHLFRITSRTGTHTRTAGAP